MHTVYESSFKKITQKRYHSMVYFGDCSILPKELSSFNSLFLCMLLHFMCICVTVSHLDRHWIVPVFWCLQTMIQWPTFHMYQAQWCACRLTFWKWAYGSKDMGTNNLRSWASLHWHDQCMKIWANFELEIAFLLFLPCVPFIVL